MTTRNIVVLPYEKKWQQDFLDIKAELASALGIESEQGDFTLLSGQNLSPPKIAPEQGAHALPLELNQSPPKIAPIHRPLALSIEHVGSTSVPALSAKPIIDIDVVVEPCDVKAAIKALAGIGYNHEGNLGIPGREAFGYSGKEHLREHHLYLCPKDSPELKRHLAFRDYLRTHPKAVEEYSRIKLEAAALFPHDIDGYINHKSPLIEKIYKEIGIDKK